MNWFGSSEIELSGSIDIHHHRPAPTYSEMLEEEKAKQEWFQTHDYIPHMHGIPMTTNPSDQDLMHPMFCWRWIPKPVQ